MPDLTIGQKLDPRRFTAMSDKMAAIVGYLLGPAATWVTQPAITELVITSEGMVLAADSDGIGANTIIGEVTDLRRNLIQLADAAELDRTERSFLNLALSTKVFDFRRGSSHVQLPL